MIPKHRFPADMLFLFFAVTTILAVKAFQPRHHFPSSTSSSWFNRREESQLQRPRQQQRITFLKQRGLQPVVHPFHHLLLWGTAKDECDLEEERAAIAEVGGDLSFFDNMEPNLHNGDNDNNDNNNDELIAEIMELGGDPSFLQSYNNQQNKQQFQNEYDDEGYATEPTAFVNSAEAGELEAMGGDPFFLPRDAAVPEKDEAADPSTLFAAAANHPSLLTSLVESRMSSSDTNKGDDEEYYNDNPTMEDLEAMGGDPSFLFPDKDMTTDADEITAIGGDPSFLQKLVDRQSTEAAAEVAANKAGAPLEMAQGKAEGPIYTAMEGESFDSIFEEVEALGGDSSFLGTGNEDPPTNRFTHAMESEPFIARPSSSVPPDLVPPEVMNKGRLHQRTDATNSMMSNMSAEEAEILEIGGDPSFLASYDEADESKAYQYEMERAEIEDLGGDPFFL